MLSELASPTIPLGGILAFKQVMTASQILMAGRDSLIRTLMQIAPQVFDITFLSNIIQLTSEAQHEN